MEGLGGRGPRDTENKDAYKFAGTGCPIGCLLGHPMEYLIKKHITYEQRHIETNIAHTKQHITPQTHKHTRKQTNTQASKQTNTHTQANKQTHKQTNKQTDK